MIGYFGMVFLLDIVYCFLLDIIHTRHLQNGYCCCSFLNRDWAKIVLASSFCLFYLLQKLLKIFYRFTVLPFQVWFQVWFQLVYKSFTSRL